MLAGLKVGEFVFVKHLGDTEYHERMVTALDLARGVMVSLTPDEDHYAVVVRDDYELILQRGVRGGLPRFVSGSIS